MNRELSCYVGIEVTTGIGQVVNIECSPEEKDVIKDFFKNHKLRIEIPETKKVSNTDHGSYRSYSRYDIAQHKHGARDHDEGACYVEVIEIKNAIENKSKFCIYYYSINGFYLRENESFFQEWNSLENAIDAFENCYYYKRNMKLLEELEKNPKFLKEKGLIKTVNCCYLTPWFYAVGDQEIFGDYVLPDNLQLSDPVFTFGKKFVVYDKDNIPEVKICLGCILNSRSYNDQKEVPFRLVCFNDGSIWNDADKSVNAPRPLLDEEVWITEAFRQFVLLISGKTKNFSINFTDNYVFKGSLISPKKDTKKYYKEGKYLLSITYTKNTSSSGSTCKKVGWVDFAPTQECPDLFSYIRKRFEENDSRLSCIRVIKYENNKDNSIFFER